MKKVLCIIVSITLCLTVCFADVVDQGNTKFAVDSILVDQIENSDWISNTICKYYSTDSKGLIDIMVNLAIERVMTEWNIDYQRNLEQSQTKVKSLVNTFQEVNYIEKDFKEIEKNKVISKATFQPVKAVSINGIPYIIGDLKFKVLKPTADDWYKKYIVKETNKSIEINKWYMSTIKVRISWWDSSDKKKGMLTGDITHMDKKQGKIFVKVTEDK